MNEPKEEIEIQPNETSVERKNVDESRYWRVIKTKTEILKEVYPKDVSFER